MASNRILSDKAPYRSAVTVSIDGASYLLKTSNHAKPVTAQKERGSSGLPEAALYTSDFETMTGEIVALTGTQDPSQNVAFTYSSALWTLGNLNLIGGTENLRTYSVELHKLVSTTAATVTTTA